MSRVEGDDPGPLVVDADLIRSQLLVKLYGSQAGSVVNRGEEDYVECVACLSDAFIHSVIHRMASEGFSLAAVVDYMHRHVLAQLVNSK